MDFARFRTLTFDCYGTLIDWEAGILGALRPVVAAHGAAVGDEALLGLYGEIEAAVEAEPFRRYREVLREVVRRLGGRLGFAPTAAEVESLPDSLASWPPFADTRQALGALATRYELVVVSNVDDDLFAATAAGLGVGFHRVVTAQQAGAYKPSERMFRLALERIGRPPGEVLHVAQSLFHDVAPARALGLATVWVNRRAGRPGSGATPPAAARPDLEVPDLATLVERLGLARAPAPDPPTATCGLGAARGGHASSP
jgi:2-haloacid dehalogenase